MAYEISCGCGKVLSVTEGQMGTFTICECGQTVLVPTLDELRGQAITNVLPDPVPKVPVPDEPPAVRELFVEVVAPTAVSMWTEQGGQTSRVRKVMATLNSDGLWIQDTYLLRYVPLRSHVVESRRGGKELVLTRSTEANAERLILGMDRAADGEYWLRSIQGLRQRLGPDSPTPDRYVPAGVALVQRAPDVAHVVVGQVEYTDRSPWAADRGVQLQAALRGADAVISLVRIKCAEMGVEARHVTGVAVRVDDEPGRQRMRLCWFAEEVSAHVKRMLLLLVTYAALLFAASIFCASISPLSVASGETQAEAMASVGVALAMVYGWPVVLLALLWVLRWPSLLRAAGLGVMAATTGRGMMLILSHVAASWAMEPGGDFRLRYLFDPVEWAFMVLGVVLCVRAWRLAGEAAQMLPARMQTASTLRTQWAYGLLGVTTVYALALLGYVGTVRYQASTYLLQPGVDSKREQEGLLAFNEGVAHAQKNDVQAAEKAWQRSLKIWEELTKRKAVPALYRANLARTLYSLGWLRQRQGRADEVEKYYTRAVAIVDELGNDPAVDDDLRINIDGARADLAAMRGGKGDDHLEEKDRQAVRKYEEAQVKDDKGNAEAETLFREAAALWEEILPQVVNEQYRQTTVIRLATAYLRLGQLQQQQGKHADAEASLKKAIEHGEKAVAVQPDRPLLTHNLEIARRLADDLHEESLHEAIDRLCNQGRFDEARDRYKRAVEEQEARLRTDKDRDTAKRRLARRLHYSAWFLAHCTDERVRDTRTAIQQARRAAELRPDEKTYWQTLATVQYRGADWKGSMATLEKLKDREGNFDAGGWLLAALNRHQLGQKDEARTALHQAIRWMQEHKRKAGGNDVLMIQHEVMQRNVEPLLREAEEVIEGKKGKGK
jgi:tetratricopeptide (TPR) repeat protein